MGSGKSKLEIEEYDPELDPNNVTAVIFVRHGRKRTQKNS
jgi:hypothetical protein